MANVRDFYAGKTIFLTGGTGFVGICLLEKFLRCIPNTGPIYLLMRPKRGKAIEERLEEVKKNQVFERVLRESGKSADVVFEKLRAVAGDVGEDGLGLSPQDRKLLIDNAEVIIHSAATLDFGDSLKTTININLLGTRRITELAKECAHLKALVHVSSAYVNSFKLETEEVIYDLPTDPDELIKTVRSMSDKELEARTKELLGNHHNTYTITKHMAEHEIKKVEHLFPCTIVRPSIIVASWKEPSPGWTISKNGPQGFLMAAGKGVIRRLPTAPHNINDYIPVDIVINSIIVAGFSAGSKQTKSVEVYHVTSSTRTPFRWSMLEDKFADLMHKYPLMGAVWYPYIKLIPSLTWYKISAFFVHFLPAIVLDTVTRISGGRPILMKLHRNVNASLTQLDTFIFTEWKYHADKSEALHKSLSAADKEDFNLDISQLDWISYFFNLALGVRTYLHKESPKNLAKAKTKDNILLLLHIGLQAAIFSLIWYVTCCLGASTSLSILVAAVFYGLFCLL